MIYVVLCEDLQAYVFVHRALKKVGIHHRDIRKRPFPDSTFHQSGGHGARQVDRYDVYACGSQHVTMNVARELEELRSGPAGRKSLIVLIDVDNTTSGGRTVAERKAELDVACRDAGVACRAAGERAAFLGPRRNIETWIANLDTAQPVNEAVEYSKLTGREADCAPAAEAFAEHARLRTQPPNACPSLLDGLQEFARAAP